MCLQFYINKPPGSLLPPDSLLIGTRRPIEHQALGAPGTGPPLEWPKTDKELFWRSRRGFVHRSPHLVCAVLLLQRVGDLTQGWSLMEGQWEGFTYFSAVQLMAAALKQAVLQPLTGSHIFTFIGCAAVCVPTSDFNMAAPV